jgi:8-oxo-dGTP pyrophosphatase MutT (NUDIX family)
MHRYVVGIAFANDLRTLLLIRKNRPRWQAGLLNGAGGKVEPEEDYLSAMVREFKEETGLEVPAEKWHHILTCTGSDYELRFFHTATDAVYEAQTTTDEPLERHDIATLWDLPVIPNLRWIIPMCLDRSLKLPVEIRE